MCVNLWTELISIRGLRKTNSRGKERLRLSLRRGGISGRTNTTITDLGRTLLGSQGLPIRKRLTWCFDNRCIRFWRRLRTNHSLNGQKRWQETPRGAIRTFIVNITKTRDILQKTVEIYGTIWTSWSERESWSSFCIILVAREARQVWNPKKMLPQDLLWAQLMSSSPL